MGQRTFIEFFSNPEFYDIWLRNELPEVYFKVVNHHIGYFIEHKTDLRFGDQLLLFSHTLGKPQDTRHCTS